MSSTQHHMPCQLWCVVGQDCVLLLAKIDLFKLQIWSFNGPSDLGYLRVASSKSQLHSCS
jgi:hypothetical protein